MKSCSTSDQESKRKRKIIREQDNFSSTSTTTHIPIWVERGQMVAKHATTPSQELNGKALAGGFFFSQAVDQTLDLMEYPPNIRPTCEENKADMGGNPTNVRQPPSYENPWKIKKTLKNSDINGLSRLLLGIDLVQTKILPNLDAIRAREVESNEGTRVTIWDEDTKSEHQLTFKRWPTTKSYVFINKWRKDFVNRRDLKEGDEIELHWDQPNIRFCFHLLNRGPAN